MRPLLLSAVLALPVGGAVAMSLALRAPALSVTGSSWLGIWYLCVATGAGAALGMLAARRGLSHAVARGMFAAYGAMGIAGLLTLGVMSALIFPDGYRKIQALIVASALTLATTNVLIGMVTARLLLRATWAASACWAFAALAASPFFLAPALAIGSMFGRVAGGY